MKQLKDKIAKGKEDESALPKQEKANKMEIIDFNKTCSSEVLMCYSSMTVF